jgi:hypothetical protein
MNELHEALAPVSRLVATLDLSKTEEAEATLTQTFPPSGKEVERLRSLALESLKDGKICFRGEPGMTFSRVLKPEADAGGCSVDAVHMTDTQGPVHTHLKGEVCLCIPTKQAPTFEGRSATWMVLPPGSRHRPTVAGGTMLILYWWPGGAVAWE